MQSCGNWRMRVAVNLAFTHFVRTEKEWWWERGHFLRIAVKTPKLELSHTPAPSCGLNPHNSWKQSWPLVPVTLPRLVSLVSELYLLLPTDTWLARALEWTWLDSAASLGCSTVIQKNEMILWVTHHGDREQWGCKHDCPGECHTPKKKAALFVPWCISCKPADCFLFYKAWQLRSSSVTYAVLEWTYTPSLSSLWNECTLHFRFKS